MTTTDTRKKMTTAQRDVLDFIKRRMKSKTLGQPTQREMAEHFEVSLGSIQGHLNALKRKGYLTWNERQARTFRILA